MCEQCCNAHAVFVGKQWLNVFYIQWVHFVSEHNVFMSFPTFMVDNKYQYIVQIVFLRGPLFYTTLKNIFLRSLRQQQINTLFSSVQRHQGQVLSTLNDNHPLNRNGLMTWSSLSAMPDCTRINERKQNTRSHSD